MTGRQSSVVTFRIASVGNDEDDMDAPEPTLSILPVT